MIRADGTFELTTFEDGDGAVAGRHRVLVRAKRKAIDYTQEGVFPQPVIDPRFERYETSSLELEVGEVNRGIKLVVQRPAAAAGR